MAEEKIKAAEVMSDDELDGVAGGSHEENTAIANAIANANRDLGNEFQARAAEYMGRGISDDVAIASAVRDVLSKNYNIDAFTRPGESGNKYYSGGKAIGHAEVLSIIKNMSDFVIINH